MYRDEHCGPEIAADAAQSEKDESRCGCRGLRLLCAGGWGKLEEDTAIDLIIGNNKKKDLVDILENFLAEREDGGKPSDAECKLPRGYDTQP